MNGSRNRLVAQIAWIIPVALLLLVVHQVWTAVELGRTLTNGVRTTAEVLRYDRTDRKDVTMAEVDLRVHMADGSVFDRKQLALPWTLAHRVDVDSVEVAVLPGASQEVVIVSIGQTQRRIAVYNAAMAFVMFVLSFVGVLAWNRLQAKRSTAADSAIVPDAG